MQGHHTKVKLTAVAKRLGGGICQHKACRPTGASARSHNRGGRKGGQVGWNLLAQQKHKPCAQPLTQLACSPPQQMCPGSNIHPCRLRTMRKAFSGWHPATLHTYLAAVGAACNSQAEAHADGTTQMHRQCQVMHPPRGAFSLLCSAQHCTSRGRLQWQAKGGLCVLSLPPQQCKGLSATLLSTLKRVLVSADTANKQEAQPMLAAAVKPHTHGM